MLHKIGSNQSILIHIYISVPYLLCRELMRTNTQPLFKVYLKRRSLPRCDNVVHMRVKLCGWVYKRGIALMDTGCRRLCVSII